MTDDFDGRTERADGPDAGPRSPDDVDDAPTVTCRRCDREWTLAFELDELGVGNQAVEQFALDHERHTGHFPDDVSPWRASCRNCPETVERLGETAVRRWATTHSRHTRHAVELTHHTLAEPQLVTFDSE